MNKNKQKWISEKIGKLIKEGLSKEIAVSKSYSAYNNMLKGGTYKNDVPKYQEAGYVQSKYNLPFSPNPNLMWNANLGQYANNPQAINQSGVSTPFDSSIQQEMQNVSNSQVDPYLQNITPYQVVNPYTRQIQTPVSNLNMIGAKEIENINYKKNADGTLSSEKLQTTEEIAKNSLEAMGEKRRAQVKPEKEQMFNPFGEIGIDQALAYSGQSFGSGNVLGGIGGLGLAGLKGARGFLSNFARAKEDKRQDEEYKRRMQEEPQYIMGQQGGQIGTKDLATIRQETGIAFNEEGANALFQKKPKFNPYGEQNINLGRYSNIKDYYNVDKNGQNFIVRAGVRNPKNADQYKEDLLYLQQLNPEIVIEGIENTKYYQPLAQRMQQGGVTNADLLTGDYLVENPNQQPTVELEDGEYAENVETGNIQEVVGEKHDNGGVKTDLPDGSKVISDYTKIGGDNAKKFKEEFDVKVRATDTFATVLDKVNKSIGLDALLEEEKEIYEKIEEQESNKDLKGNVRSLNLTALQKKLQNITEQKEALKEEQKSAFDKIFEEQEKIPKKKGNNVMREGGVHKDIDYLSKKYKIDKDRLITLMAEGGFKTDPKKVTKKEAEEMVKKGIWEDLGNGRYRKKGTEAIEFTTVDVADSEGNSSYTVTGGESDVSINDILNNPKKYKTFHERTKGLSEEDKKLAAENLFYKGVMPSTKGEPTIVENTETIEGTPDEFFYTEEEKALVDKGKTSKQQEQNTNSNGLPNIPIIPQDFILPPSARQSVYKQSIQLERMDSKKGSAEEHLVELERQRQAYNESIKHLSPMQKAALEAYGLMQTQKNSNQAISEKQKEDAQGQYNVDVYNLQAQAKEDLLNSRFEQDYETKTMAAIGNQELDVRQYFNDLNNQQRYNFEYIDRRNLLNQAFPNYNVSGSSNIGFTGGSDFQDVTKYFTPPQKPLSQMTDEEFEEYRKTSMDLMEQQRKR